MSGYLGGTPPSGSNATQASYYGTNTTNLKGPNGDGTSAVWVPEIFSKNVLLRFRRESVAEGITNNDYFGEISAFGDTVRILKEPVITIGNYSRGDTLTSSAFQDSELVLTLDQAHQFQFEVDDLESKLAHVNWEQLASGAATYNMKMAYDLNVLGFFEDTMASQFLANKVITDPFHGMFVRVGDATATTNIAAATTPAGVITALQTDNWTVTNTPTNADEINPLNLLSKLALYLDKQDVPMEGRYVVVGPEFMELLADVDSKLINQDYRGGALQLDNGLQSEAKVRGFEIYSTNNATPNFILAGHKSAVATANSIINTEKFRSQTTFADVVRGLHVFGRALVREESICGAYITYL